MIIIAISSFTTLNCFILEPKGDVQIPRDLSDLLALISFIFVLVVEGPNVEESNAREP